MSEYLGNAHAIALQESIRSRADEIASNPLLANGGRIVYILDPDAYGWENIRRDAERDGFVGLTMVDRDATMSRLADEYDESVVFPYWDVFTGSPGEVLTACAKVTSEITLPDGWAKSSSTQPDEETIDETQLLNAATGVSPTPAYYLRGEQITSMLTCLRDKEGNLAACASGTMRYHPEGLLAGYFFAGGVSVGPDYRRMGLGSYVNATLLADSQNAFAWTSAIEQAKADNPASVGMITRCGLRRQPGKATIVVNTTGGSVTR
jgi:hypothetical protein